MSTIDYANSTGEEVAKAFAGNIKGKTVLITGISPGGFGAEVARVVALVGAKVVLAGRSLNKVRATADAIKKETPNAELKELLIDLGSQKAVRQAADQVLKYSDPIDVLILNAGVMGSPYEKTVDGLELQFASNHIGNFLFTNLIMPKLFESSAPRVVSVSSVGHFWGPFRFEDYGFEDGKTYDKWDAYGQSKTANILFAVELAKRYKGTKLTGFSIHPGGAITSLYQHMTTEDYIRFSDFYHPDGKPKGDWAKPVEQCIPVYIVAGFDPSIADKSGSYLIEGRISDDKAAPYATDKENAKKLWDLSEKIVGQKF